MYIYIYNSRTFIFSIPFRFPFYSFVSQYIDFCFNVFRFVLNDFVLFRRISFVSNCDVLFRFNSCRFYFVSHFIGTLKKNKVNPISFLHASISYCLILNRNRTEILIYSRMHITKNMSSVELLYRLA